MLLFDFVDDDVFAASLSEFVVEDGAWDGGEEKHVQEDEDDEVNHVGLVILDGQELIIRVIVVSGQCVGLEDHFAQIVVVGTVLVVGVNAVRLCIIRIEGECLGSDHSESSDNDCVVDDKNDEIFIS